MKLSYSNLSLFRQCPLKWYYHYQEGLLEPPSAPLIVGDLFHRLLEAYYSGDMDNVKSILEEFQDHVAKGTLDLEKYLLEEVLKHYVKHYEKDDKEEKLLSLEEKIELDWEGEDTFVGIADKIVEKDDLIIVRDTKTTFNPLKYTGDDVMYNPQFLMYAAIVEEKYDMKVDAIEVDEVRIAELEKPLINKNGRPTADFRKLGLVTYEDYYKVLVDLGIEDEPEYEGILKRLKDRGHPLFRRIRVQLVDTTLVNSALNDLYSSYKLMKQLVESDDLNFPRHRSRLCNWCGYRHLCNLDHYNTEQHERDIVIDKNLIRKEDEEDDEDKGTASVGTGS